MSSTSNAGGQSSGDDVVGRLSQMGNRTTLMVIDATLNSLPKQESGYADAAAEIRALARRMRQATLDFRATVAEPVTEPAE